MKADWREMVSSIYGLAADTKNFLFDSGLADSIHLQVPVLSVGNLSVGGTGKTPVVQKILSLIQERGAKASVIARNYRARSRGIHQVNWQKRDGASFYGDEAFLISQKFKDFPVWTGPKKFLTAQQAVKSGGFQMIVVDDGFQHRSLHRDFDLVLLDASSPGEEDHLLPVGRLRENFSSLDRASAVLLTKVNWAQGDRVEQLKKKIPNHIEIYEMEFHARPEKEIRPFSRVLIVSGIAKPQMLQKSLGGHYQVADHLIYPDHHHYQSHDATLILQKMKQNDCNQILTTEKDFVKLQVFEGLKEFLNPVSLSTEFKTEPRGLYAFLDQSLRH